MSAYQQKPGTGTLFQNDQRGNDRAPNWRGSLLLEDGTELKVAAWTKRGAKGEFLSLSIDKPRPAERDGGESFNRGRDEGFSGGDDKDYPF